MRLLLTVGVVGVLAVCSGALASDGDAPFFSAINGTAAYAVSADGSVVVGLNHPPGTYAFRWEDGVMTLLGDLPGGGPGGGSYGYDVSADGSVVVGSGRPDSYLSEAFRWTEDDGMVGLGDLPGGSTSSEAYGVSADGSVVVGIGTTEIDREAFRWEDGVMTGLGDLPGGDFWSGALDVSAGGSVVIGSSSSALGHEACRWVEGEIGGLGDLPGGEFFSYAFATSGDGSVIVGHGTTDLGYEAFIWDEINGMRSLRTVLVNDYGLSLDGWTLEIAFDVSYDGTTIVGMGVNPSGIGEAWVAHIPEPTTGILLACGVMLAARRRQREFTGG